MVSIFTRGAAVQGQNAKEVLSFLAAVAGTVPAVGVVYESRGRVEAALLAMKLSSPAELLEEIAEKAAAMGIGDGTLVDFGAGRSVAELRNAEWPEGLHPVRDKTSEKVLRFRIGRHQRAPSETPG